MARPYHTIGVKILWYGMAPNDRRQLQQAAAVLCVSNLPGAGREPAMYPTGGVTS
jgi:hypothetical protein